MYYFEINSKLFACNTALLESLDIRSISKQYHLHKILFIRQIKTNSIARAIMDRLLETSYPKTREKSSFLDQLGPLNRLLNVDALSLPFKQAKVMVKFKPEFLGVVDSLKLIYHNWWNNKESQRLLCLLLKVDFGTCSRSGVTAAVVVDGPLSIGVLWNESPSPCHS